MEETEGEAEKRNKEAKYRSVRIKEQQSKLYREQEHEFHVWLSQDLNLGKTAAIMTMLEQMVETRSWKEATGLINDGRCRICN